MQHPLARVPSQKRHSFFVVSLILTLAVMVVLQITGGILATEAAPQGIISFEFARSVSGARAILDSWDLQARAHAGFSLGFDFLFLLLYSTTIAAACVWLSGALGGRSPALAVLGLWLGWGQWLAALLDALENGALVITLLDAPASPWPQVASVCAAIKFALVFLGLFYALLGALGVVLVSRKRAG